MLKDSDYQGAANFIGCDVATIKAITAVEAPRGAYDEKGRITILFEPYIFWKQLRIRGIDPQQFVNVDTKTILSPKWDPTLYGKYSEQWGKLVQAVKIDRESAYRSASYGLFQLMGFNAEDLKYKNVFEFVKFMEASEYNQLIAFCKYVKFKNLDDELRLKEWTSFAEIYNGPLYRKNNYDLKLKEAYSRYANIGS